MRFPTETSLALAGLGLALATSACMPTDIGFAQSSDIDQDCETLNASISIRSVADARALPLKCFNVNGEVEVVGSDLTDLEPLEFLRQTNVLRIVGNDRLRSTDGLDRVRVTDHLDIDGNPELVDLDGLDRTESVRRIDIVDNAKLADLSALGQVEKVGAGGLHVLRNESVGDLKAFESLLEVGGDLKIEGNRGLRTIGLTRLKSITTDMVISDNSGMAALAGFSNLESVGGNVAIERNDGLGIANGFTAKFQSVGGNLSVVGNSSLTDIYDLAISLYSVAGSVICTNNLALTACRADDLDNYITVVGGDVDVGDNSADWDPCH